MPTTQQKFLTVSEFLEALGGRLSKNTVYSAINRGEIPCVFVGRRRLIPEDALTQMLQSQNTSGN
jgi:excisionase family DNA binding protein